MKIVFDGREITLEELKEIEANLDCGPADGGDYEQLVVDDIVDDEIHLSIGVFSSF
jgi:hypothetical protein